MQCLRYFNCQKLQWLCNCFAHLSKSAMYEVIKYMPPKKSVSSFSLDFFLWCVLLHQIQATVTTTIDLFFFASNTHTDSLNAGQGVNGGKGSCVWRGVFVWFALHPLWLLPSFLLLLTSCLLSLVPLDTMRVRDTAAKWWGENKRHYTCRIHYIKTDRSWGYRAKWCGLTSHLWPLTMTIMTAMCFITVCVILLVLSHCVKDSITNIIWHSWKLAYSCIFPHVFQNYMMQNCWTDWMSTTKPRKREQGEAIFSKDDYVY